MDVLSQLSDMPDGQFYITYLAELIYPLMAWVIEACHRAGVPASQAASQPPTDQTLGQMTKRFPNIFGRKTVLENSWSLTKKFCQ